MPASKYALLRYRTIDKCLTSLKREWTLDELVEKCQDALYDYIELSVSKRTIQADIQFMRSDNPGYSAPIVVVNRKYYKYDDPNYSILKAPISMQDIRQLGEAMTILRQMSGMATLSGMEDVISRLDDHLNSISAKQEPIVYFERNDRLRGLEYIPIIHQAIVEQKVMRITYQSFRSPRTHDYLFSALVLKEFRNRWFVFGTHSMQKQDGVLNFALDRIKHIDIVDNEPYRQIPTFNPEAYFAPIVGVTRENASIETVRFWASPSGAPYIATKPIHHSQKIVHKELDGSMIFEIQVIINKELMRDLTGYAEEIKVLAPQKLVGWIKRKYATCLDYYKR